MEKNKERQHPLNPDARILELRSHAYSCGEATLCGMADALGLDMDENFLRAISVGFRGGIGASFGKGTCGALSGAVIAAGLAFSDDPKRATAAARTLYEAFIDKLGTVACGDMHHKGRDHCNDCCLFAAKTLCNIIESEA